MKNYLILILLIGCVLERLEAQKPIIVGTKHSNESYILGELICQILTDGGFQVERKFNLGGTAVSFEALKKGSIDIYPEYSGTISSEILKQKIENIADMNTALIQQFDLTISKPYGFNNTYAMCVTSALSKQYALQTISDLKKNPLLKGGMSYEFLKRVDGWSNLSKHYSLKNNALGLEHGLAYQALQQQAIDFTDAYSTDGEVPKYDLVILKDDLAFFPKYEALSLYRRALPEKAQQLLKKLDGVLSDSAMQRLNSLALFEKQAHISIAHDFLVSKKLVQSKDIKILSKSQDIFNHTVTHLKLTLLSLLSAIFVAVPLGMVLYRWQRFSKPILYAASILQTIPSIALLALMIPFLGIGVKPAVIALFLYALLPILQNTVVGFSAVDPILKRVATAIGLTPLQRLWRIELPLAMPMILTGIRTAAVINVGTATLAAFIGAGGLGEFIVTGLALNQTNLILMGAIPSAILAICMELLFDGATQLLIHPHLRQKN